MCRRQDGLHYNNNYYYYKSKDYSDASVVGLRPKILEWDGLQKLNQPCPNLG